MKRKKVLIIDGASSGRLLAASLIDDGHEVYHMTSGSEEKYRIPDSVRESYILGMTDGMDYAGCFRYDTSVAPEENAEQLRGIGLEAVIPGTESGVLVAELMSRELGIKGNNPETFRSRRDKYYMQLALKNAGIRSIDMLLTSSCEEALEFFRRQTMPRMIVKPCSAAGSELVYLCTSEDDVRQYFAENRGRMDFYGNSNDELLLQEYITGTEYVANSVSRNGRHLLTDAYRYRKVNTREDGGFFLYDRMTLLNDISDFPLDYVNAALDAVGIENGVSHMEIKIDDRGPVMIEVGARPMGESCHQYQREALGYNMPELILASYADDKYDAEFDEWYNRLNGKYSPEKYLTEKIILSFQEGELEDIPAYENLMKLKTVRGIDLEVVERRRQLFISKDEITSPGIVYLIGDNAEEVENDSWTIYDWERNHPEKLFTLKDH